MILYKDPFSERLPVIAAPALSAFAGHVPANFTKVKPEGNYTRSPNWANFNKGGDTTNFADVWMLEVTDPLFVEIGNKVRTGLY